MSALRKGWSNTTIQDVLQVLESGSVIDQGWSPRCEQFPSLDETTWGALKTTAIQDGYFEQVHTKQLPSNLTPRPQLEVRKGDLLMTCAGPRARCGVVCKVENVRRKLFISGKMYRFRADNKIATSDFILAILRSRNLQQAIDDIKTGGSESGLNLTQDRFKSLVLPIPPLAEQKRIVAKLDALNAKCARARAELSRIETLVTRYKQAVLTKAFCGEFTRDWRGRHDVDFSWQDRTIADVAHIASGQTPKAIESFLEPAGAVSWFKVSSMNEAENLGGLHSSQFRISAERAKKLGLKIFPVGSIAFPKRGGAIATNKKRKLAVAAALDLNLMVLIATEVKSDFLWWWIQKLDLSSISNGSSVPQINNGDIAPLRILVPSIEEQNEIVHRLETTFAMIDRIAVEARRALGLVGKLNEAILAKAFRGELVTQDENDEPASVLLERIRSEREATPKAKRGRKKQ